MQTLFSALEIPHDATLLLNRLCGELRSSLNDDCLLGIHFIEPIDYHITLRYFGDIENHMADKILAAFDHIKHSPFDLQLNGLGVFGSKKPFSLYAHVVPCKELDLLHAEIECFAQKIGFTKHKASFTPHVTIARLKQVKLENLQDCLSLHEAFSTPLFKVNRFVLMSANASVGGGPYAIEAGWPLVDAEPMMIK